MGHFPSGTSRKSISHLSQLLGSQKYQEYDYGEKGNLERYGTAEPREIRLQEASKSGVPIVLIEGLDDQLITQPDARWARDQLGDAVAEYLEVEGGHMSFLIGRGDYFETHVQKWLKLHNGL